MLVDGAGQSSRWALAAAGLGQPGGAINSLPCCLLFATAAQSCGLLFENDTFEADAGGGEDVAAELQVCGQLVMPAVQPSTVCWLHFC